MDKTRNAEVLTTFNSTSNLSNVDVDGVDSSINFDLEGKARAMARIAEQPFVQDALKEEFCTVQDWITNCGRQVKLPQNFCGGVLIMRLCRQLVPKPLQVEEWVMSVHDLSAAYDFAFLALGHADDESDVTRQRSGEPTRWVTHAHTRAVDGINLLLAGITAAQNTLNRWPTPILQGSTDRAIDSDRILEEIIRALREASFPILLDRAGFGHKGAAVDESKFEVFEIDRDSLNRVELYSRHRAQTYFLRAVWIAVFVSGYDRIEPTLENDLDELFALLGSIGAAADDLQDTFVDFSSGVHSIASVMAHLCVAENEELRPNSRKGIANEELKSQRIQLATYFGASEDLIDKQAFLEFLNEIGLRKALEDHYEVKCVRFAEVMYSAVTLHGFSIDLMSEIVSFVCQDPDFSIPPNYMGMLQSVDSDVMIKFLNSEIGKYINSYFLDHFWPTVE